MKKTITLLLGLFFGLNLFGQYVNYETDSRWFLNANVGGTWQTTDVENKTYAGWGLILGKSFNYNYGKFLRWDLRGRYLGGKWYGQDYDSTGLSNGYTGVYNPYKDSLGYSVQNFESENHELGLELAVHLNRLRERTGVDLYAFGGANIVWNRTNGDLFDQDTLLGFNNIYNYEAIGLNESSIDDALDGIYDTPLDGHTQKYRANFMPSLGFGIGYYFSPHFSVGLEHKTTFTLLDDWDGFESDVPQGKGQFLNDIYHYTSGYLRFHFRQGRTRPTNLNNNSNNNNLVGGGGCQDPVIAFIQPSQATTDVTVSETQFKVKVSHVVGRENITLRVNGNVTTNFLYNAQTDVLESYLVLAPGMNTIQVTAGNGCGSVSQNYTINYINCIAPEISFTAPSHNNFRASQSQFDIRANIERASSVKFKVNGISTTSFYYNAASGSFQSSVALQPGQNVFELVATNECGTDTETVAVSLSDCNDPSIVFLNSNANNVATDIQQFTFKAQVLHVEGRGNIGFRINGVNKQFTFDPDSKYMSSGFTLQEGTNTIQVTAANDCGTETETFTVEFTPCVAPFIQMIDPIGQALQTTAASYIVKAKLFNVESLTQVQLTVNGALVNGGQLNPTTKVFQKQVNLQMGENIVRLAVTTDCGTDIEVTKVTRVREQSDEMITICHRPPGNEGNVQTIEIPLSAWAAHQAHGDVLGPCPEVEEPSNEKITICHRPPGNPENTQTIEIPLSAWAAHQAHGDVLGPCPIEEDHSDEKITICHHPPGNTGNPQTIEIPLSAWPAHQAHGDVLGPCPEVDEPSNEKVTICHHPPGNTGNPQTIEIPFSAWPAHQAHGDVMGPCPEEPVNPGNGNEGNNGNPLGNQKITICHYPPGNNGNPQTIEIPLSAWPAHRAHGDKLGPCPERPGDIGNGSNPNNPGGQIGNPTGVGNGEASGKIKICHYPPGNTDNPQTIEIPLSAWPAHQAHGDVLGPCPEEPNNSGNGNEGENGNSQGTNTNTQGGTGSTGTIGGSGTGSTGTVSGSGNTNTSGTNTNTQGGTGSTGTIGGSGTGSTGTVTGSGSTNTGGTNTNTQGGTGSTGTIGGSGTGSTGTVSGSGNTNTSGTNTNTQGGTGSTGTIGGSGSGSTGTVSGAGSGTGGGDEDGGNKSNTGTSGGKGSGGDNFNNQSSSELREAEEAARKKAAEAAAKKKAAEEAAKKKAAEEAARKKAAEEAAKKKAAEAAAKKKAAEEAAEEAARKKAAEEAARKKAEEEAARKKAAEEAARKKAAEEAAKKKAAEEAARKKAAEEAAKKKAAEAEAKKKAAEEAARKKAAEEAARKKAARKKAAEAAAKKKAAEEAAKKKAADEEEPKKP